MSDRKLTPKQEAFVDEYLIDLNATAAASRAGYKDPNKGRQLVTKSNVADAIAAARQERQRRTLIDADRVVRELTLVALSDVGDVLDFSQAEPRLRPANEIPEAARRAISSVKVRRHVEGHGEAAREVEVTEFKLWNKLDALGKLMPHVGLKPDAPPPPPAGNTHVNVNVLAADLGPYAAAIAGFLAAAGGREVPPDGPAKPLDTPPA